MNKKHLKIYKGIALVAGGITLANMISSAIFVKGLKLKPFAHNEIKENKVTVEEYTKDGTTNESYYSSKNEKDYLIVKLPYTPDLDNYSRFIYNIKTENYSEEEIDFIIKNIDNVELLLEQEYIQNLLAHLHFSDDVTYEMVPIIPEDNNYEFRYVKFDIDENDYKIISSKEIDLSVNMYYLLITGVISITEFIMYITFKKVIKEKSDIKTLEKQIHKKTK